MDQVKITNKHSTHETKPCIKSIFSIFLLQPSDLKQLAVAGTILNFRALYKQHLDFPMGDLGIH